ncbi:MULTISPECIES: hypothetical protein [Paraburkholderia]|jgi:hypothetical protein|uniref:Uncharacterized protein n=1 Tax=Paraburkholderia madseniana TaxID=2599607 RepID=A0A6N6W7K9_9BURK|nr:MULTISPECIES: hypothetical protein [Paraburkholderia]KAE8755939.1 hypothetical protein FSO04_31655 [Paraburkholderia madseniana]MCX4150867.1 hypothetical protein [Paraburkholderia madseniana]MCX4177264.1 hypothetical protein [Paraburkholderia madseniana]MDN7153800.1 hypothetical protein [Paraburkholderia sp. WS6]MDQ6412682.1 hypothetical protein [Paraburkholderia madseniana]
MYNRQLPGKKEALARKLAGSSNGQCTVQQMADMLWLAGVKGNSITPDSIATVNVANAGTVYDNPSAGEPERVRAIPFVSKIPGVKP